MRNRPKGASTLDHNLKQRNRAVLIVLVAMGNAPEKKR